MMGHILVTGAGGFIGGHLCRELVSAGFSVRAATRRPVTIEGLGNLVKRAVIGDVGPGTDWSEALTEVGAVIHLAARTHILKETSADSLAAYRRVNVEGTRSLVEASIRCGVRRFLLISSIKAVGEETRAGEAFSEESPCHPSEPYGISKWEAEQVLRTSASRGGMEWVVMRPPMVYGPGVGANFMRLLKVIDRGVPLPLRTAGNPRSLLFVRNLTSAVVRAVNHAGACGRILHVADDRPWSTEELVRRTAELMERPARLFPFPALLLELIGKAAGRSEDVRRLVRSLVVATDRIRSRLDWEPPFTTDDGLRLTVDWYRHQVQA